MSPPTLLPDSTYAGRGGLLGLPRVEIRVEASGSLSASGSPALAPLSPALAAGLSTVSVRQRLGQPAACELTFLGPGQADGDFMAPGTRLEVMIADRAREPLFAGEVTAVEVLCGGDAGVELRVRAYDLLHRLRKHRTVRAHVNVTPAGLARDLAAPLGLTVEAEHEGPVRAWLLQDGCSDLELLTRFAATAGLYPLLHGRVLSLRTLAGGGLPPAASPPTLRLGEELLEARFEASAEPCCRQVEATGWNPSRTVLASGRAARPRSGRRVRAQGAPSAVGGDEALELTDLAAFTDSQAEALAQAELDRRHAGEVIFQGVAVGDPRLTPGRVVELAGVPSSFEGLHVLTGAEHTIGGEVGYVTELTTIPPSPPGAGALVPPAAPHASWGTVTQIDDPEDLGRVKVSLPTIGGVESDWLAVLAAGAGAGKGILALPDLGDQVLVLFLQGDPAGGVVLGGLYGVDQPPDSGLDAGARRRFTFLTPGGQRLRLDDGAESVRLETAGGSFLEMGPEKVHLHAEADFTLEAPEKAITILGARIDFRKG